MMPPEKYAYLPLLVLIIVCGGIILMWLAEQLGKWLLRRFDRTQTPDPLSSRGDRPVSDLAGMYVDAQERKHWSRPPRSLLGDLRELLERRPDLDGIGISYLAEAVAG